MLVMTAQEQLTSIIQVNIRLNIKFDLINFVAAASTRL